ncbi:hypothetical protein ACFL03_12270 [Thermodesulfobacteriota bacterium]
MENLGCEILHGASLILLFMFIVLFSKMINDLLTPYKIDDELTNKDNVALSTGIGGYFSPTTIIYIGALLGPTRGIIMDLLFVGGYSVFGVILLNISRCINDREKNKSFYLFKTARISCPNVLFCQFFMFSIASKPLISCGF